MNFSVVLITDCCPVSLISNSKVSQKPGFACDLSSQLCCCCFFSSSSSPKMPFSSELLMVSMLTNPVESPSCSYQLLSYFFCHVYLSRHTFLPLFLGHGLLVFFFLLSGFMFLAGLCSFSYWSLQGQSPWTICLLIHCLPRWLNPFLCLWASPC